MLRLLSMPLPDLSKRFNRSGSTGGSAPGATVLAARHAGRDWSSQGQARSRRKLNMAIASGLG